MLMGVSIASCGERLDLEPSIDEGIAIDESEIINGTIDGQNLYPAVGLLVTIDRFGTGSYCTATLVDRHIVLTAAHCVVDFNDGSIKPDQYFFPGSQGPTITFCTTGSDGLCELNPAPRGVATFVAPGYDRLTPLSFCGAFPRNDLALVVLDAPVPDVTPLWIASGQPAAASQAMTLVGFGRTEEEFQGCSSASQCDPGYICAQYSPGQGFCTEFPTRTRRSAPAFPSFCPAPAARPGEAPEAPSYVYSYSGPQGLVGQICSGDSGGPTIQVGIDGAARIVGVHSIGSIDCRAVESTAFGEDAPVYSASNRKWLLDTIYDAQACAGPSLISVNSAGVAGDGGSFASAPSPDARVVAFSSWSANLVPGDTNQTQDVFAYDRRTRETKALSSGLTLADGPSDWPAVGGTGVSVAIESSASNLVPNDTNGRKDIFLVNSFTGVRERVSVATGGAQGNSSSHAPSLSARRVVFHSYASNFTPNDRNQAADVFVRELFSFTTSLVSMNRFGTGPGNRYSGEARLSADGNVVVFRSLATDLIVNDTNGQADIFVRSIPSNTTERVSVGAGGQQANGASQSADISGDGRFVVFASIANNLVPSDTNSWFDIFVRDRLLQATFLVSVSPAGAPANGNSYGPRISRDGRFVTFFSYASNLVGGDTNARTDIFIRDLVTSQTRLVSSVPGGTADGFSYTPSISDDGRLVTFYSYARNIAGGDTGVYPRVIAAPNPFACTLQ